MAKNQRPVFERQKPVPWLQIKKPPILGGSEIPGFLFMKTRVAQPPSAVFAERVWNSEIKLTNAVEKQKPRPNGQELKAGFLVLFGQLPIAIC